ncbi:MAG: polymerase subunit sigma-70 [Massilia sp.]|jgi:anti-sigma-K factor RskA|nr:polymerase subunit sigma-70 [Massilia sp.]
MTGPIPEDPHDGDDTNDLAGEYVLGTLSASERLRVEQALERDAALRDAVLAWEARLLGLTTLVAPVAPPPELWRRIEGALAPAAAAAAAAPRAAAPIASWWNNLNLWRGLAAGGLVAAAIMAAVIAPRLGMPPAQKFMVVLAAPQNMRPGWIVQATDSRHLRLVPLGLSELPQGKSLQFWTKADGWTGPVSLGLVTPGQPLEVSLESLPPLQPNQLFEITLEPPTGSPIGKPTGPILFIGRAVAI